MSDESIFTDLVVTRTDRVADDIVRFELRAADGRSLPAFTAGSHVTVKTPVGALRKYSMCNAPQENDRYVIAVKRDAQGRGGSLSMCDSLQVGARLPVGNPVNEFALSDRAKRFLFIAGGIGITPVLSMMRDLAARGREHFHLYYCTRSETSTAFAGELTDAFPGKVTIHHDGGDPARAFDFWPILQKPTSAHVYCCGPRALMDGVRDMTGHWPFGAIHFESFGIDAATRRDDKAFDVRLAQSGKIVHVAAQCSILEALRAEGVFVRSSCEAGSCGSCRTGLVAGEVEHRDFVLGENEHSTQIMVCVSRARSPELVLDL
jgi:phthalate 4,5-dioxygenase reductase subunit